MPSLTLMTMPLVVPTSRPSAFLQAARRVLNVAQDGLFAMLNVSVSLSASVAVGRNEYGVPGITAVAGVPEIVGARFGAALTMIENGASAGRGLAVAHADHDVEGVPTCAAAGVPAAARVALKVAQPACSMMLNVSVSLSASLAVGGNVYGVPTVAVVARRSGNRRRACSPAQP